MRLLEGQLLAMTRGPLERWGHTFYAFALYVADTAGPPRVYEIGMEHSSPVLEPGPIADSLRRAIRGSQTYYQTARTVGIVVDSIAGPFSKAGDGIEGLPFPRLAITELEDQSGRCCRIEREYHFERDERNNGRGASGWGLGKVVYGAPRVTRCEPRRYWPEEKIVETPTRPRLAAPIVRSLFISSLGNYFSVVGKFSGMLTVFDDSIVVEFDSLLATRRLPQDQQLIELDSIRVGVGMGENTRWSPMDDSEALRIGRSLQRGGLIERKNVRFVLRHERRESDDAAWVVVTFHITVGKRGEPGTHSATTYAHSERGVLAVEQ